MQKQTLMSLVVVLAVTAGALSSARNAHGSGGIGFTAATTAEEMQAVKQEYRHFLTEQRRAAVALGKADEMRQVKLLYRAFLFAQRREAILAQAAPGAR